MGWNGNESFQTSFTISFPYFKRWKWYLFTPRIRFGTWKVWHLNQPSNLIIWVNPNRYLLGSAHEKFDVWNGPNPWPCFHERFFRSLSKWEPKIPWKQFLSQISANFNRILIKFKTPNQVAYASWRLLSANIMAVFSRQPLSRLTFLRLVCLQSSL